MNLKLFENFAIKLRNQQEYDDTIRELKQKIPDIQ